jgi:hypothetical protein
MCDHTSMECMAEVPQCPTDPVRGLSLRQTEHMDEAPLEERPMPGR